MRPGTPGFSSARLREAREARGLTATALAEMTGVSRQVISQYETGEVTPGPEVLHRMAGLLNLPIAFLSLPSREPESETVFYRSLAAATKTARTRAERRFRWLKDIVSYLGQFVELPTPFLPRIDLPADLAEITRVHIEDIAAQVRRQWSLGDGPISNMVWLLENNGCIVSRGILEANTLDAFSSFRSKEGRPYIFLGSDKDSAARSRFDAAHELGHMILHRGISEKRLATPTEFRSIEAQADAFASCFLLPAETFARDLAAPTLDAMHILKEKWRVSIAAMVKRAADMGMITPEHAQQMWISRARRGWTRREPLDDQLRPEQPAVLPQAFDLLIQAQVKSRTEIVNELSLSMMDIEQLASLPESFFFEGPRPVQLLNRARSSRADQRRAGEGPGDLVDFPPPRVG